MMQPYLLTFSTAGFSRQALLDFLDTRPEVLNWYAFAESGVFVISEKTPHELSAIIHGGFPWVLFVVTHVPASNNNGWLPKAAWDFINNPRSSGRWK
jgi:hypothetical protein